MKKMIILSGIIAMIFSASCGKKVTLKSESDTLSYILGKSLGDAIKQQDSMIHSDLGTPLDREILNAAMKDVINGNSEISDADADAFMRNLYMIRIPAAKKEIADAFMAEVERTNPNVKKTASGLLYEIITPGSDKKATSEDEVRVMYRGMHKDGTEFESSFATNDTVQFPLNRVIPGWTEGIQLVGEGGKIKLWLPAELGYGEYGSPPKIGQNEALIFEVELYEVIPAGK